MKLVLEEQRSVHIGQTVPRLVLTKWLNHPSQQEHARVQI